MSAYVIDNQTIEACQCGDSDAFRLLFEGYKDRVYSIALCYCDGNEDTAKDITQQVFLKLMSSISKFEGRSSFATWLYRFVVNACLDRKRAMRRFLSFGTEQLEIRDKRRSVEDAHIRREMEETVRTAIAGLKPKLRIAILLKYFEDLSYDEMAVALGCSKGTVASRLNRGHRLLAQKLAHLRDTFPAGE